MKNWIVKQLMKIVCKLSDDYYYSIHYIQEDYDNVPDNVKGAKSQYWTIWMYYGNKKEEALKWLNKVEGVNTLDDGFGNTWSAKCAECGGKMEVVRPGKVQCSKCG